MEGEAEWEIATIVFVDIRGFTGFADRATAREAVAFLNEFFEVVLPVLLAHGGGASKLLGDGVLSVFGPPAPSHADRALAASRGVVEAVDAHFGDRCRIGIGINSGLVLMGTIGGGGLTELGVIGDPVNVAARVQDATRDLGEALLLTEATRCLLDDPPGDLRPCGTLQVTGRQKPVAVYGASTRNDFRTARA